MYIPKIVGPLNFDKISNLSQEEIIYSDNQGNTKITKIGITLDFKPKKRVLLGKYDFRVLRKVFIF